MPFRFFLFCRLEEVRSFFVVILRSNLRLRREDQLLGNNDGRETNSGRFPRFVSLRSE